MSFINCVVNCPEDLMTRIRLRKEFESLGLLSVIKTLRGLPFDDLMTQLDTFEDEMEADYVDAKEQGNKHHTRLKPNNTHKVCAHAQRLNPA